MSSFRIRPRFEHKIACSPQEIRDSLQSQSFLEANKCEFKSVANQVYLSIPPKQQHFWSPQLSLQVEEDSSGYSLVRGLYGPSPNVWILFVYGYAALGILGTFLLIIGLSQWTLGEVIWGLWGSFAVVLGLICLYIIAQMGQKLGAAQTFRLHHCYEEAIGDQIILH